MFPFRSRKCYPGARTAGATALHAGAAGANVQKHQEFQAGTGAS